MATLTTYAGLDYGLGQSNIDFASGIRYGVISQHSIDPDCLSDLESDYGSPHCPDCGRKLIADDPAIDQDADWNDGKDFACADCQACYWSDQVYPDEPCGLIPYVAEGYRIEACLDSDLFILQSDFFTYAQFCSPCVPGAGNLDSPMEPDSEAPRAFCLGHDWFDAGKAPYRVWKVSDGSEVLANASEVPGVWDSSARIDRDY